MVYIVDRKIVVHSCIHRERLCTPKYTVVFTPAPATICPEILCPQCPNCTVFPDTTLEHNFARGSNLLNSNQLNTSVAKIDLSLFLFLIASLSINVIFVALVVFLLVRKQSTPAPPEPSVSFHQNPDGHEIVNLPLSTLSELNKSSLVSESSSDLNSLVVNDSPQFPVEDVLAHDPLIIEQSTTLSVSSLPIKASKLLVSSFSFPEVPTAGEILMLDLERSRRFRQAKENLISTPPTPITFTDL